MNAFYRPILYSVLMIVLVIKTKSSNSEFSGIEMVQGELSLKFQNSEGQPVHGTIQILNDQQLIIHRRFLDGAINLQLKNVSSENILIRYFDEMNWYQPVNDTISLTSTTTKTYVVERISHNPSTSRPNIVLILADDLGYGSVTPYGLDPTHLTTPNIAKLASQGRIFTNAYTPSSVCSPTRYGILTGRYDWRTKKKHGVLNVLDTLHIGTDQMNIAGMLKSVGYNTSLIGKWHLGYQDIYPVDYSKPLTPGPLDIGFDYQWAVPSNAGDATGIWVENDSVFGLVESVDSLSENQKHPEKSYYGSPMLGIPAPFRPDSTIMAEIKSRSLSWLDRQSDDHPFFLYLPTTGIHEPIIPSEDFHGSSQAGLWGDFVLELDDLVGSIYNKLEEKGVLENTLIVFTSDNGGVVGSPEALQASDLGIKINGDLRGGKTSIWEGGFKVPLIFSWPGVIPAGSADSTLFNLVDLYSSIASIAGIDFPVDNKDFGPDSFNRSPSILGMHDSHRNHSILASGFGTRALILNGHKYIDGEILDTTISLQNDFIAKQAERKFFDLRTESHEFENLYIQRRNAADLFHQILTSQDKYEGSRPYYTLNSPPVLTDQSFLISNNKSGSVFGSLVGSDHDNDSLTYGFLDESPDLIGINGKGDLFLKSEFDPKDGCESIRLRVFCSDGLELDTANIDITFQSALYPKYPEDTQVFSYSDTIGFEWSVGKGCESEYELHVFNSGFDTVIYSSDTVLVLDASSLPGSGEYQWNVVIDVNGGRLETDIRHFFLEMPLRVEQKNAFLFPNPTSSEIFLQDCHDVKNITLFTSMGQVVMNWPDCKESLTVGELPSGIYQLSMEVGKEMRIYSLIIE